MKSYSLLPPSLLALVLLASTPTVARPSEWPQQQPLAQDVNQSATKSGSKGAVASESSICSQIGIDLLAYGGNAVDAYIGTQLCVGVIGMMHSGLGGGGFTLVRDSHGNYTVIDYRETAPAAAYEDMYSGNINGSIFGGLATGVPGELRGLEALHRMFGSLPWKTVVEPAAHMARDGFPVTEDLVRYMKFGLLYGGYNFFVEDPSWALDFAPHGSLVGLGDTMYRKRYAETLMQVAEHGADVFYNGPIAEATIASIQQSNGTMTLEDLSSYQAIIRQTVSTSYNGYKLYSSGSPSSGAVCLSTLKTMEGYSSPDGNLTLHRFDEAMRFAYGAHQSLGDPPFLKDGFVADLESKMLSVDYAGDIRSRILDNATQPVENYDPEKIYTPDSYGTSHIVAADSSGMAVSGTTTINILFGNLVMVPETGVILNNEMNDFSIPGVHNEFGYAPSEANYIRPGKRPLSSITPVIVEHASTGRLLAVVGAAGGSRIISSTTQVVWHVIERALSMTDAVAEPRFHDQLMPNVAWFEVSFDNATVASMAGRGHNTTWVSEGLSAVQGILLRDDGSFEAAGERRQKNSGGLTL